MKYFMSVFSPSRECRRVFEMGRVSAEYYYGDYCSKLSDIERQRRFETGEVQRPSKQEWNPDVYIWGEDISDAELFKRRLIGTVDKDTLESPL